jgi:hypothetical protein
MKSDVAINLNLIAFAQCRPGCNDAGYVGRNCGLSDAAKKARNSKNGKCAQSRCRREPWRAQEHFYIRELVVENKKDVFLAL